MRYTLYMPEWLVLTIFFGSLTIATVWFYTTTDIETKHNDKDK
jgi:hypothetical protein